MAEGFVLLTVSCQEHASAGDNIQLPTSLKDLLTSGLGAEEILWDCRLKWHSPFLQKLTIPLVARMQTHTHRGCLLNTIDLNFWRNVSWLSGAWLKNKIHFCTTFLPKVTYTQQGLNVYTCEPRRNGMRPYCRNWWGSLCTSRFIFECMSVLYSYLFASIIWYTLCDLDPPQAPR